MDADTPRGVYRGRFAAYGIGSLAEIDAHLLDLAAAMGHYAAMRMPAMVDRATDDYKALSRLRWELTELARDTPLCVPDLERWFA